MFDQRPLIARKAPEVAPTAQAFLADVASMP